IGEVKIRGKIIVLELRAILDGQKLVSSVPSAFQEGIDRLRCYENYAGNLSASQLFQCHGMRDEHFFHLETEAAENEGAGIGGCSPLRVEVDLLTHQLLERFNFRTNENVQFRRKQAYYVCNTLLNL